MIGTDTHVTSDHYEGEEIHNIMTSPNIHGFANVKVN